MTQQEIQQEIQKTYLTYASITPVGVKHQLMEGLQKIERYIVELENKQAPAEEVKEA